MFRHLLLSLAIPIAMSPACYAQKRVDMASLAKAGQASLKRLEEGSASWTSRSRLPSGAEFVIDTVTTKSQLRRTLSVEFKGGRQTYARMIEKEGDCYVTQGLKAAKYRYNEAPFDIPTSYMYMNRANPRFVISEEEDYGTLEGVKDGVAIYRTPLAPHVKAQLESTIREYDRLKLKEPARAISPDVLNVIETSRALLEKGITTSIEVESGMLIEFGAPERRSKIENFRWVKGVGEKEFATDGRKWEDFTQDPTLGDRANLIAIGHNALWNPGMKSPELDGRLFDLKTGRFRRIPFDGDLVSTGCFNKDRSKVIVPGTDTVAAIIGLYEIDLKTGENRRLGGDLLATGFTLFPALSPDGKTVAALHKGSDTGALELQPCLIDLETGNARPIGRPLDTGGLSWFPDGKGLLLVSRDTTEPSKPSVDTICRMDLQGKLVPLLQGSAPVILDAKRILFEDKSTRTWKTCNFEGKEVRDYAGGMKGHGFPAPSPDGKRLIMMRFQPGKAPVPTLFDVDSPDGKPITTVPGLWGQPAWR